MGAGSVLSFIDIHEGEVVPPRVVLHGLKQSDGRFVCRIFGVEDNPKEGRLFGHDLTELFPQAEEGHSLWDEGTNPTLWNVRLYPECDSIKEVVACALKLYDLVSNGSLNEALTWQDRKSLCAGFQDADPKAILDWNKRMAQLVQMNRIEEMIFSGVPASEILRRGGRLEAPLSKIQREWIKEKVPVTVNIETGISWTDR